MRNVMVRCTFSALIVGLSYVIEIFAQERHGLLWSQQQVLSDDWQPFVPSFAHERQFQNFPPRLDTTRYYFGKNVNDNYDPAKKSFQLSASSNVDQYAVPPILGSFNSFGLQTIQTRNPILEKNIKDGQPFLDQSSHLHSKYYHQPVQQVQSVRRYPTFIPPPLPQYTVNHQYQHYPNNQFSNRLENPIKQPQPLLPSPSRTIATSVQVFPPSPQNAFPPNAYFLGVPPKSENYVDERDLLARKQTSRKQNDFLANENVATIYGSRDPALNIAPPTVLKSNPFVQHEPDRFSYDGNVKRVINQQRYEVTDNNYKQFYDQQTVKQHADTTKKPLLDGINPSKQVYEQLSQFGRPFSLPQESATEYIKFETNKKAESDPSFDYGSPAIRYKTDKTKSQSFLSKNYGRVPASNSVYSDTKPKLGTPVNVLVDYEPGKLQSVKTVTYVPQRDLIRFNEEDVSLKHYQNEKYSTAKNSFLPTPTESHYDDNSIQYDTLTTSAPELTSPSSALPPNHKYSNTPQTANTRNRYPPSNNLREPVDNYHASSTESQPAPYNQLTTLIGAGLENEDDTRYYETTTKKHRRRKPSKIKNKEYTRYKTAAVSFVDTPKTEDVSVYYSTSGDVSSTTSTEPVTVAVRHPMKKKPAKLTTTESPENDYPNYPNYPQFVKQYSSYPKEYEYPNRSQYDADHVDYFNSVKEDDDVVKENYPTRAVLTTAAAAVAPATTATTAAAPLKPRIKNRYGNATRPRFSIKDIKRASSSTTIVPTTASASATDTSAKEVDDKKIRKFTYPRYKNKTETSSEKEDSASEPTRRYKPRTRPSRYRSTSTTVATETTTERVNTFKPSTNRYRSSTSKYYNRYRTTTEIANNAADDTIPLQSDKKPVRTMLFSAKRSSILRSKSTTPRTEEDDEEEYDENGNDAAETSSPAVVPKKNSSNLKTNIEKADDASLTDIMTSSEERAEKDHVKISVEKEEPAVAGLPYEDDGPDDDIIDIIETKENEVTTESSPSSTKVAAATATATTAETTTVDEQISDDDSEKVSKVSSLTSVESQLPISFVRKWSTHENQKE